MRLKYFLAILCICLLFIFPQKVQANENAYIYYFSFDAQDEGAWDSRMVSIPDEPGEEARAAAVFDAMFADESIGFIPENTRILGITLLNGHLYVNVSRDMMNYGGCYYERRMMRQIAKTALALPGVDHVTLLIEGRFIPLPEGSLPLDMTDTD